MEVLYRRSGLLWMFVFVVVFLIATYAISQVTSLLPRVLQGALSVTDALIGICYVVVAVFSILILGRMIYSAELLAGRVRKRVKLFE